MRKYIFTVAVCAGCAGAFAQSAIDAYRFAQPDLKGTARFMGMAGAFTALGADASSISQNPAGLGVYRKSELGFSLDLDMQNSKAVSMDKMGKQSDAKLLVNNVGSVWAIPTNSEILKYVNFAFSYNRNTTYNRGYRGVIPGLRSSLSDYMAATAYKADGRGFTEEELSSADLSQYNPYNPPYGMPAPSWLAVMGYNAGIISPVGGTYDDPQWGGVWGDKTATNPGTSGVGGMRVEETGCVNSYNLAFATNIADYLYIGMDFDITHLSYEQNSVWRETLENAYVYDNAISGFTQIPLDWSLSNYYRTTGAGFNYKLGMIVRPIPELRLGVAFHTPTWYDNLSQEYRATLRARYNNEQDVEVKSDNGRTGYYDVSYQTPWKLTTGIAGVIGSNLILSADAEWNYYKGMKFGNAKSYGGYDDIYDDYYWDYYYSADTRGDWAYDSMSNPFAQTNDNVRNIYRTTTTLRFGAEYRLNSNVALRGGYSYVSSPVEQKAKNDGMIIDTAGTMPEYRFDNNTNYVTCGVGYSNRNFFADLAYVWKNMKSEYHAFTPDPYTVSDGGLVYPSPQASVDFNQHQVVVSMGVKF